MGLFDDRQVGGKVGVEDGVESQPPQCGDHLARARRARRKAEPLADRRADGRGRLHDDVHLADRRWRPRRLPALRFSTKAAVGQTLMHCPHWMQTDSSMLAPWAGATKVSNPRPCWLRLCTPWISAQTRTQRPQRTHFSGIAHDRMAGQLDGEVLAAALEVPRPHAHRIGQVLQLAVAVALAGLAVLGVVVQEQLDDVAAGLADVGRVGLHLHALPHLLAAGGHVEAHILDLDDAHPAGAHQAQIGVVAEPWDADSQPFAGLHDRRAFGDRDRRAVDGERKFLCA